MNSSRKRSRTLSHSGTGSSHQRSPLPASANGGGASSVSSTNKFILDKNERLLRLNVGGYPYDVVRTSLPLLETMSEYHRLIVRVSLANCSNPSTRHRHA